MFAQIIQDPPSRPPTGLALFRSGFRPFFLFGAAYGLAVIVYFIALQSGAVGFLPSRWDAVSWHRHEMLFGFTVAIIAGFLFTAVPNWTGQPTPKGRLLAGIVLLWLAGRAAIFCSAYLPPGLVALVDVAFLPACAAGILPALLKARNRRNYFFVGLLALLAIANALTHAGNAEAGIRLALNIVILVMTIVGGRVIPFFTEKPLRLTIRRIPRLERFVIVATIIALALDVVNPPMPIAGIAFALAAAAQGWRLALWQSIKTLRTPLLWVLHAGYAWLVIGFALKAAYYFGAGLPPSIPTHAFTAGGIGTLTLGMMARVSLGHSGRALAVGKPMVIAFACVTMAAILRVFAVWLLPGFAMTWLKAAACFWLAAFGLFLIVYTPILLLPRTDGGEG